MIRTKRLGRQAVAEMLAGLCKGDDACPAEDHNARCPFRGCDCENIDAGRWLEAMKEPEDGSEDEPEEEPEDKPEDKPKFSFGDKITVGGRHAIYVFRACDSGAGYNEIIFEQSNVTNTVEDHEIKEGWLGWQ